MKHEATIVLDDLELTPRRPADGSPERFVMQLAQEYFEARSEGPTSVEEDVDDAVDLPESPLHKPGWFNKR